MYNKIWREILLEGAVTLTLQESLEDNINTHFWVVEVGM